jgi:putative acyl-CoA dehydrogenase
MRAALSEAAHHVAHRRAFGVRLADAPLMAAVVADLAPESEAATALAMRLAAAVDAGERALLRIALPASKYYVRKRAPAVVAEALECLGGIGYVEDSGLPRLYREAPLGRGTPLVGRVTTARHTRHGSPTRRARRARRARRDVRRRGRGSTRRRSRRGPRRRKD